jgi:hypothetical protein
MRDEAFAALVHDGSTRLELLERPSRRRFQVHHRSLAIHILQRGRGPKLRNRWTPFERWRDTPQFHAAADDTRTDRRP